MNIFELLEQQAKFQRFIRNEIRRMDRSGDAVSVSSLVDHVCTRQRIDENGDRQLLHDLANEICRRRYRR